MSCYRPIAWADGRQNSLAREGFGRRMNGARAGRVLTSADSTRTEKQRPAYVQGAAAGGHRSGDSRAVRKTPGSWARVVPSAGILGRPLVLKDAISAQPCCEGRSTYWERDVRAEVLRPSLLGAVLLRCREMCRRDARCR